MTPRTPTLPPTEPVMWRKLLARAELEGLSEALKEALDEMAGPVARAHDATKGSVWQMGHDRDWAEARSTGP